MIILGIDPGYGRVGYGLVHKQGSSLSYITAGCIETEKTESPSKRLHDIYQQLTSLITTNAPGMLAIEQLFFAKNTKTALRVAETRGILLLLSEEHRIPMREFTPQQVKVATCDSLLHCIGEHHTVLQVLGDVTMRHPGTRVCGIQEDVD